MITTSLSSQSSPPIVGFCLRALLLLLLLTMLDEVHFAHGQATPLSSRISREIEFLEAAQRQPLPPEKVGRVWANLGSDYEEAGEFALSEDAYNHALQIFRKDRALASEYATVLDNFGSLYLMYGRIPEARRLRERALAKRRELKNPVEIARGESHIAEVLLDERRYKDAAAHAAAALRLMEAENDPDKEDEGATLVTLIYALCAQGKCSEGLVYAHQALEISAAAYEPDSVQAGYVLMAAGFAEWKQGDAARAEDELKRGVEIFRRRMEKSNRVLIEALRQYEGFLSARHQTVAARRVEDEVMRLERSSSAACSNCTVSAFSLEGKQ
jgi:tetratricopeptide (TPR) repeat protein